MNRIYLALGILFSIAGIGLVVHWGNSAGGFTGWYLLNFIPAVAFALAYLAGRKFPRKLTHIIAIPSCVLALVLWSFIAMGIEMFISSTSEVTDVKKYEYILDDAWDFNKSLVAHFPRPIPQEADGVKFSFLPAFMQGGAHIQLRYSLSADTISDLYERYSEEKTRSFIGGDTNTHINMKNGMPTTFFYTSNSDDLEFPDAFEIMVFDEAPKKEENLEGHNWNHGQSHGVAISKTRNEIVYWAESW